MNRIFVILVLASFSVSAQKPDSSHYRINIGANFDFINKLKASNVYAELNVFVPRFSDKTKFGLMASFYQSRSVSVDSSSRAFQSRLPNQSLRPVNDSVTLAVRATTVKINTTVDNLGLVLVPCYEIYSDEGDGTTKSTNRLYLAAQIEVIRRNLQALQSATFDGQDTVRLPVAEVNQRLPEIAERMSINQQLSIGYFGAGLIFSHSNKYVELLIRPTLGVKSMNYDNRPTYYNVTFQLHEKKFDLVLGGEVRGNFPNDEPYINIYLAKTFSLSKLAEFFGGN